MKYTYFSTFYANIDMAYLHMYDIYILRMLNGGFCKCQLSLLVDVVIEFFNICARSLERSFFFQWLRDGDILNHNWGSVHFLFEFS